MATAIIPTTLIATALRIDAARITSAATGISAVTTYGNRTVIKFDKSLVAT
jgi:hypothetical protein